MENIHRLIKIFKKMSPYMTANQMEFVLTVALYPGEGTVSHANRLKIDKPSASHIISRLGSRGRRYTKDVKVEGLNLLIQMPSPTDARRTEVYLTPKGAKLVRDLLDALK